MVKELAQGNAYSRSSDGGGSAYQATRKWRVLLSAPNESWDVHQAIGVQIGDAYGPNEPLPCVSVEAAADGESRHVRIVTATYRTSPSAAPGIADPKTQEPTVRPALYSMSTSLTEIAAWGGKLVTSGVSGAWQPNTNPTGQLVDGLSRLEPVVTVSVEQYSASDQSQLLQYTGYVNSDTFAFSSLTILPHGCMLQSVASNPVVEQFGGAQFRGFKVSFGFAIRAHWTATRNGTEAIGWDMAVPQTGFDIVNTGLGRSDVDQRTLSLEHSQGKVVTPYALAANTSGSKMRASVALPAPNGGEVQRPSAQPVALNDDGTPRNVQTQNPKVLINRICIQPERSFGNNFSAFGIRWIS
jgi:hypothetical protein